MAFSRDGKTVYVGTGYRGGVVYRVDVQQNKSAQVFDERTSTLAASRAPEIHDLAVSPNGKVLAVGVFRGIVLIDLKTNKELRILPEDESVAFRRCCFSPDGRLVASVSSGITLWDAGTGKSLKRLARTWERGAARSIQFSPDGEHFVAGIDGGEALSSQVAIWKTDEVKPATVLDTRAPSLKDVEFTPDGKQLAACHASGVKLWNFRSAAEKPGRIE